MPSPTPLSSLPLPHRREESSGPSPFQLSCSATGGQVRTHHQSTGWRDPRQSKKLEPSVNSVTIHVQQSTRQQPTTFKYSHQKELEKRSTSDSTKANCSNDANGGRTAMVHYSFIQGKLLRSKVYYNQNSKSRASMPAQKHSKWTCQSSSCSTPPTR